jgi:hypothetical protein
LKFSAFIVFAFAFACSSAPDDPGPTADIALATDNEGGNDGPTDFNSCVIGCEWSYSYCKAHQAGEVDCDAKLQDCYDYCNDVFPIRRQVRGPRAPVVVVAP